MKIYIPTKNRFKDCKTAKHLHNNAYLSSDDDVYLIVEPNEYDDYKKNYGDFNIITLPKNNQGIAYARNFIKKLTLNSGVSSYWLLDDDISNFYERQGIKLVKKNILYCLHNSQIIFEEEDIALGSLEYRQFAWSSNKRLIKNSFCDSVVYINNILTKNIFCNEQLKLKVDRDFTIQVLYNGLKTARDTYYAFSCPPNGSNSGGLKEIAYDVENLELDMCKKMVEIWGESICKHIIKKDGRNDLKIFWKNINKKQLNLF